MKSKFSFHPKNTKQRKDELIAYFQERVFFEKCFVCYSYSACKKSHSGEFYKGQLHHVGKFYDVTACEQPYRIAVIGQEYGHPPSNVSMDERREMVVEDTGQRKTFTQRNPHMRGTTSVLRLLYDIPLGKDHKSEFLQPTPDLKFHIYDAFALVNYLLCSAVSKDEGSRGKSTRVMKKNCLVHFLAALDILEPTVIIVQGKGFWKWVKQAFDEMDQVTNELFRAKINNIRVLIAVFTHPSTPNNKHNWGRSYNTSYLLDTVVPTVEKIKQELHK